MAKKKTASRKASPKKKASAGKSTVSLAKVDSILKSVDKITMYRDLDAILDNILLQARELTRCDAGSIFLKTGKPFADHRFGQTENSQCFYQPEMAVRPLESVDIRHDMIGKHRSHFERDARKKKLAAPSYL